jgi:hypothetical protein
MDLKVWAGVLPLSLQAHAPISDEALPEGCVLPDYLKDYDRKR